MIGWIFSYCWILIKAFRYHIIIFVFVTNDELIWFNNSVQCEFCIKIKYEFQVILSPTNTIQQLQFTVGREKGKSQNLILIYCMIARMINSKLHIASYLKWYYTTSVYIWSGYTERGNGFYFDNSYNLPI